MSISKLPYEVDSEVVKGVHGRTRYYKLLDADGKSIMDTLNSEVACIHDDDDGDSGGLWDEQGRVDMEFVAIAANLHGEMVAALQFVMKVANQLPNTLADVRQVVEPLLEKAGSFHKSVESFHKERDSFRAALEQLRSDCQCSIDLYERLGPSAAFDGCGYYPASFVVESNQEKIDAINEVLKAALTANGEGE